MMTSHHSGFNQTLPVTLPLDNHPFPRLSTETLFNVSSPPERSELSVNQSTFENDAWLKSTLSKIRMCFLPIILLGTVTNCLNFVLLSHKEMRPHSTSVFLFALAVADIGVMYLELFRVWFEWTQIIDPDKYFTDNYCRVANYVNGVVRDFSNWLIACLTLERLIKIAFPYRAQTLCTTSTAKRVSTILFLIICVPHIQALFYSTAQFSSWWVCWEKDTPVARALAATVEFVVGYVAIIVVFALNMILTLIVYRKNREPLANTSRNSSAAVESLSSAASNLMSYRWRTTRGKRLTRTLLVVALVFLVCETPRMLLSFLFKFIERTPFRRIVLNAAFALSGVNHAANFFIYILSSPRFRQLLCETLRLRQRFAHCFQRWNDRCAACACSVCTCKGEAGGAGGGRRTRGIDREGTGVHEVSVQINLHVFVAPPEDL